MDNYLKKEADITCAVRERRAKLSPQTRQGGLDKVTNLVLIASASRSGSSLLYTLLRKMPGVYSLPGETVPYYKLHDIISDADENDHTPGESSITKATLSSFYQDLRNDFSYGGSRLDLFASSQSIEEYGNDLARRFSLQWPEIAFAPDIFKILAPVALKQSCGQGLSFSCPLFFLELIKLLRREYPAINPYYYDLPEHMIKAHFHEISIPSGPPNSFINIEEPPFITVFPEKKAFGLEELENGFLLLKTPADCYRLNFLKTIFPNAKIKIIHLTRNPAATINGLYQGWLYRGFFSRNLRYYFNAHQSSNNTLKITGYSDQGEWAKWWWNFDLPPDWQSLSDKSLEEVCAFQWLSANQAISNWLNTNKNEVIQINYEDLLVNLPSRLEAIKRILGFLRLNEGYMMNLGLTALPTVQATSSPEPFRWKKKKAEIVELLKGDKMKEMCQNLGYDGREMENWL